MTIQLMGQAAGKARLATAAKGTALAGALLALAACGSAEDKPESQPASIEDVKQEASQMVRPEPGLYRKTFQVLEVNLPDMPPQAAEQLKSALQEKRVKTQCLTQAEVDKGFQQMFEDDDQSTNCTFERFDVSGEKLEASMTCQAPGSGEGASGGKAVMTMTGTVGRTSSDIMMTAHFSGGQAPVREMDTKSRITAERIGDCPK